MIDIHKKLTDAGVKYTTEYVFSNFHKWKLTFHGTRYVFPTLADARKAEKATGHNVHGKNLPCKHGNRGSYYFTLF